MKPAGIVERTGSAVSKVKRGDHVILSWAPNCGECFYCHKRLPTMCNTYGEAAGGGTLWYLDADSQAAVEKICPTIGLNAQAISVLDIIRRYEDLAVALGIDPDSASITTAKQTFATSVAAFTDITSAKPDLKVLTISSGDTGTVYLWNPNWLPDLIYLRSLGFTAVDVGADEPVTEVLARGACDGWDLIRTEPADR